MPQALDRRQAPKGCTEFINAPFVTDVESCVQQRVSLPCCSKDWLIYIRVTLVIHVPALYPSSQLCVASLSSSTAIPGRRHQSACDLALLSTHVHHRTADRLKQAHSPGTHGSLARGVTVTS